MKSSENESEDENEDIELRVFWSCLNTSGSLFYSVYRKCSKITTDMKNFE